MVQELPESLIAILEGRGHLECRLVWRSYLSGISNHSGPWLDLAHEEVLQTIADQENKKSGETWMYYYVQYK